MISMITHTLPLDPHARYVIEREEGSSEIIYAPSGMLQAAGGYLQRRYGARAERRTMNAKSFASPFVHLVCTFAGETFALWRAHDFDQLQS